MHIVKHCVGRFLFGLLFVAGLVNSSSAQVQTIFDYNKVWRMNTNAVDLGTAWRAVAYDDSLWPIGTGVLATASEPLLQGATIGTVLRTNNGFVYITNFYFRTTFVLTNISPDSFLVASNQIDDGAVIYLNENEVGRFGMSSGAVNYYAFATRANDVSTTYGVEVLVITNGFVVGTNTIAVEVHQANSINSDAVWGQKLVLIQPRPLITTQPQAQSVWFGGSATFAVTAGGDIPLFHQWRKDGTPLLNGTNSTLVLSNVQFADVGDYTVVVTNSYGSVTSVIAALTIGCVSNVMITTQPSDQSVSSGGTFSLSTIASGAPPFGYQWYQNGNVLTGATNATYVKTNAQPRDSGFYSVVVTNCGSIVASSNAVVGVSDAHYVLAGLRSQIWKYDDSGTNWGTAWRAVNFDDSAWKTGRGVFALETDNALVLALTNTVLQLTNAIAGRFVTNAYFRTSFALTNEVGTVNVIATNLFDDGAVVYVNGVEAYRLNLPSGAISATTFATGGSVEGQFIISNIAPSLLLKGTNHLAVELHQVNASSSDLVMGLSLLAVPVAPTVLSITNQPLDIIVSELKLLTLAVGVSGKPAFYQWFKDGIAIPSQNGATLTFTNAVPSDAGEYFVLATNVLMSVTSRVAHVVVETDFTAPRLLAADALDNTHVFLTFSEPLLEITATNAGSFAVADLVANVFPVLSAVLTNGTNVLLTTSLRPMGVNQLVAVSGVADISPHQNLIATGTRAPIGWLTSLLPYDSTWDFYDPYPEFGDDPDPGPLWNKMEFMPPGNWGIGEGAFYAGTDVSVVPAAVHTILTLGQTATDYFRRLFDFGANSRIGTCAQLDYFASDGVVFYLNGLEVARDNMPTWPINSSTLANSPRFTMPITGAIVLDPGLLLPEANLISAELHVWNQQATGKVFGAKLQIRVESIASGPIVITRGPENLTVRENRFASFSFDAAGARTIQWRINGTNVPGATTPIFSFPAPLEMHGAMISVVLSNDSTFAESTNARLQVITDTTSPTVVRGELNQNQEIVISFSEMVSAATATNLANYLVTNSLGQVQFINSITLVNGSNAVLQFVSLPLSRYFVVLNGVRDPSVAGNVIQPNTTVQVGFNLMVQPMSGVWRYDDSGVDRGTAWTSPLYNDSAWATGAGLFAAKRGTIPSLPEPVRTTMNISNASATAQNSTFYFRKSFVASNLSSVTLTLRVIADDGCAIYLNGQEVMRLGMAAGAISYGTLANRTVNVAPNDSALLEGPFTFTVTNLVNGTNVIAVEVHQSSLTSADAYWAGEFTISLLGGVSLPLCPPVAWAFPQPSIQFSPGFVTNPFVIINWLGPITNGGACSSRANFMLEQAMMLSNTPATAAWFDVTNIAPVTVSATNGARFFRLRLLP